MKREPVFVAHARLALAATLAVMLALMLALAFGGVTSAFAQESEPPPAAEVAPPVPPANPLKTRDELEAAYQREYAFLEAQLRDLKSRSEEFNRTASETERERQAQIDRIEGEYIDLQTRGERINDLLAEAERQVGAVEDNSSMLESTFLQASATLEPYGIEALRGDAWNTASDGDRIDLLLTESLDLLGGLGKLRQESGSFFLADGTLVDGTIINVGSIAAFGIAGEGGGALVPAGDGRMKVWSNSTPDEAKAVAAGQAPATLNIFLFESADRAIEEQAGQTVVEHIQSGGSIAWIITVMGVLALILIVLRVFFLRTASASTGRVEGEVGPLVREARLEEALQACKRLKGSTARVVASAVRNLDRDRAHIEDIVSEQILHESAHLNRFGSLIIVIAAVAPLLGLLGTVTGMISTFDIITEFGTGDPKLLSSGISIALVTTEVGLAVAIPALIFGNLLSGWADSIKDDMEKAALHVMNLYLENAPRIAAGN